MGSDHKTVVESTSNWYWLSDLLSNHQIEITLAHAKYLKAISYAKVKTDKVDSQILAQLLRMNLIPAAHQISPEKRGLRDMMRARLRLVPGANNSNRKQKHKSGNKDGNKYLKMAFTEAGFRAVQYYKEIKQFYQSKSRKKHKTIARILVAKELAKICYFMLKEKREFNNTFKSVNISKVKSKQWPRLANPAA